MTHFPRLSVVCAVVAGSSFLLPALVSGPALAAPTASRVNATYVIKFNGLPLGKFYFESKLDGASYSANGRAKMKLLFGAFKWYSITEAQGVLHRSVPKPSSYSFKYETKKKRGSTQMNFSGGAVSQVVAVPKKGPSRGRVPVVPAHLRGVFDPMSAIMAMTASTGTGSPCRRSIPVFDGKQRFNLVLTPKRRAQMRLKNGSRSSVHVCKVKYVPVSGHKMNRETKYMASTDGIEVWFAPLRDASMNLPVNIVLPTVIGSASIRTKDVRVETTANRRIALQF